MAEKTRSQRFAGEAGLSRAQDQFVAVWAQMGSTWGIPRTMAEVHALLYVAGRPMNTDEIMDRLRISRGSASMTLRALVDWGIVSRAPQRGDRREYFEAEQDVWKLFRTVVRERTKREIDPLLEALRECRATTQAPAARRIGPEASLLAAHNRRVDEMLEFVSIVHRIAERFTGPSGKGLQLAAKMLGRAS